MIGMTILERLSYVHTIDPPSNVYSLKNYSSSIFAMLLTRSYTAAPRRLSSSWNPEIALQQFSARFLLPTVSSRGNKRKSSLVACRTCCEGKSPRTEFLVSDDVGTERVGLVTDQNTTTTTTTINYSCSTIQTGSYPGSQADIGHDESHSLRASHGERHAAVLPNLVGVERKLDRLRA